MGMIDSIGGAYSSIKTKVGAAVESAKASVGE